MSTVLSYNSICFKLLMADTRVIKNDNRSDDCLKIHYIKGKGFISGIGIGELIQRTFRNILKYQDIACSYNRAYQSIKEECIIEKCNKEVLSYLNKSAVVVADEGGIYTFSNEFIQVISINGVSLKPHQVNILYPYDISEESKKKINATPEMAGNIEKVIMYMLNCFKKISESSKDVSNICSIAVIKQGSEKPFFIQSDVEQLIERMKQSSFENLENEFDKYEAELITWDEI